MLSYECWLENQNNRLPYGKVVKFIYNWAHEYTSIELCEKELQINKNTAVEWKWLMRDACVEYLTSLPKKKIGGEGLIV